MKSGFVQWFNSTFHSQGFTTRFTHVCRQPGCDSHLFPLEPSILSGAGLGNTTPPRCGGPVSRSTWKQRVDRFPGCHVVDCGSSILMWMIPISSQTKCFYKSFCRSQLPHNSVNLSITITNARNKLTELCGNWHLRNDFENTSCEIRWTRLLLKGKPRGAGLSWVDTFSISKTNETLNKTGQLATIFSTWNFKTMKIRTFVDSLCSEFHWFSRLKRCHLMRYLLWPLVWCIYRIRERKVALRSYLT